MSLCLKQEMQREELGVERGNGAGCAEGDWVSVRAEKGEWVGGEEKEIKLCGDEII